MVPPWVGEHPDVFNDPNFSITPNMEHCNDSWDMEVSVGGAAAVKQAIPLVRHPMAHINVSEMPAPVDKDLPINEAPPTAGQQDTGGQSPHVSCRQLLTKMFYFAIIIVHR